MKRKPIRNARERKLRVGVVPYLNVKPLIWGMEQFLDSVELVAAVPRELARRFRRGVLDVATIPVFEYFRHGGHLVVPSIAIACRGEVQSIRLFCRKPLSQVRTILADRSSLTSLNLLRILINEHFKIAARVRISSKPLTYRADLAAPAPDAFLIIGDAAIQIETTRFHTVYDLGEEWLKFSGLPFVFAVWTVRRNVNLRGFDQRLLEMKQEGSRHLRAIAKRASRQLALPEKTCCDYLRNSVRHDLGDEEIRGMKLYYKLLVKHKLCPAGAKIRFYQGTRRPK